MKVLMILLITATFMGCSQSSKVSKKVEVMLYKDKVYEIAYASIIEAKQKQLFEDYFPKAGLIISEYGGKNLASFGVVSLKGSHEIDQPDMLVLFEWPSLEVYEKTISDERLKKLFPVRDGAFSQFGQTFVTVAEDTPITFQSDKSYEFFLAWINPEEKASLGKYFEVSEPIKKSYGRPEPAFKANLNPVSNMPKTKAVLSPHMVGIVEWDKHEDSDKLTSNKTFVKEAKPLFDKAVSRIEMIYGRVNTP